MAVIDVQKPEIITISFRQERSDKDYGSCLWARFNFDLIHYSLAIESDCGNYSHGWVPTPDSESFLQLCSRMNWEYLLGKISAQTIIDSKSTFRSVKELMEQTDEDIFHGLTDEDLDEIESACRGQRDDTAAYMAICTALEDAGFLGYDPYDVACCIQKDYPSGAKKIAEIYRDHIQLAVRKLKKEVTYGRSDC